MADVNLVFTGYTSSNPATPLAPWATTTGAVAARVDANSYFRPVGSASYAGWTYSAAKLSPSANILTCDARIVGTSLSSYNAAVTMLNGSGNGYMITIEPFNVKLHRVTGGINGTKVQLSTVVNSQAANNVYTLKYNISTGLLSAEVNSVQVTSATDSTYISDDLYGGFGNTGFLTSQTGIAEANVYNVQSFDLTIGSDLTPNASRTDTCAGFSDGAATISFSGVSAGVTISSGSFTWTVPMLADGVEWPRLPATAQTITLTQGLDNAAATANVNLPTGHETLRVGDVVGGGVANFSGINTTNDRMLGYHFLAAANPLTTDDTAYFVTSDNYWVYRNSDVGADTASLPRTDTLYIQDTTTGVISSHSITLTAEGVTSTGGLSVAGLSATGLSVSGLSVSGL